MAGESALATPPWKQGEDAALALRHRLHLGDGPINIWEVIRRVGVRLALHDLGEDGSDGMYVKQDGWHIIHVNTARRISRQRFTAAHELGHHEMHRHRPKVMLEDLDIFAKKNDPLEEAANSFAGNLLAPAAALDDALRGKRGKDIAPTDVVALMGQFGMSYEATCNRLRNADFVRLAERNELLRAGRGNVEWMLREAGIQEDALFAPGRPLPEQYIDEVVKMWQHHHITDARLGEMLRIAPDKVAGWLKDRKLTRPEWPESDDDAAVAELMKELS